jgi:hypothetical protein
MEMRNGYHQIPVHQADVLKTATITLFSLEETTRALRSSSLLIKTMPFPGFSLLRDVPKGA